MKSPRIYLLLLVSASAILLVPFFFIDILPLHDYPNHLARTHILGHLKDSPILQRYYEIHWEALPNLAMDLVVPMLAKLLPLETAGKLFCALVLLSAAPAVSLLHYALHGKLSIWPLVATLFVYNYVFILGFVNYLGGVNLALASMALWIWFRDRPLSWTLPLFTACSTLLFFTHLYALGLYGIILSGYEISLFRTERASGSKPPRRAWVAAAGQFLLPVLVFLFASPTFDQNLSAVHASSAWAKLGSVYSVFNSGDPGIDGYHFLIVGVGLLAAFTMGAAKLHSLARLPVLLLIGCFLALPGALFGSGYADYRLPIAALLFLIAGSNWTPRRRVLNRVVVAVALAVLAGRSAAIAAAWGEFDQRHKQVLQAINRIPEGSKVFEYMVQQESDPSFLRPPVTHLVTLAVIYRSAFVPTLFAYPGKHPVRLTAPYRIIADRTPHPERVSEAIQSPPDSPDYPLRPGIVTNYDYLFLFAKRPLKFALPSSFVEVAEGTDFELYKLGSGVNQ